MESEREDIADAPVKIKTGSRILRFFRFVLRSLVVVLVGLLSAVISMRIAIHGLYGNEVKIPNLIGKAPQDANRLAAAEGLTVFVDHHFYSPDVPQGLIVSQMPPPGTKVRPGWRIRVAESLGPQSVNIPSVVGESMRAAEINLKRRGLEVGMIATMPLPGAKIDQIAAQSPPANAVGVLDPRVGVLIPQIPDPPSYVMPNFIGEQAEEAVKKVQASGFVVGRINRVVPVPSATPAVSPGSAGSAATQTATAVPLPHVSTGKIVHQYPAAGQKIFAGTTIQFDVD